ncbi:MAG: hypothetical protein A3B68_00290 [Candidatus Melainabacteria bacterium RIFCSPHIGHO2_02_FULL_34_12]|nr:MAG: hypothetical protein A3B68_00290 [Candidatus Melainabacteria bacterium RIFCSPHIGHO2_02_FULL_34_12]
MSDMKNKSLLQYIFLFLFILFISDLNLSKAQILEGEGEGKNAECILCTQVVPDCKENEKLVFQTCDQCAHCEPIDLASPTPTSTLEETKGDCQKCLIHAQCQTGQLCINDCCAQNPKRQKKVIIKPCIKSCTSQKQCSQNQICRNKCCVKKPEKPKQAKKVTPIKKKEKPKCIVCTQTQQNCKEGENLIKQTCTKCAYCKAIETKIKELKTDGTKCKNPCGTKCCKAGYKCITINQCKGKKKPCMLPLLRYCDKKAPDPLSGRLSTFECE